jgi:hypothetical protein
LHRLPVIQYQRRSEFIKSKTDVRDADLAKKAEGTCVTSIPDLSSDPVTGFGFDRSNIYWNGTRTDPFFAYTPYQQVEGECVHDPYTLLMQRELILSDVPYYKRHSLAFKTDFKRRSKIHYCSIYFGSQQSTLGELRATLYTQW